MEDFAPIKQRAKQGDPDAIAALINQSFRKYKIEVAAQAQENSLVIHLSGSTIPSKKYVNPIRKGLNSLGVQKFTTLEVSGKQREDLTPAWVEVIPLVENLPVDPPVPTAAAPSKTPSQRESPPAQKVTANPLNQAASSKGNRTKPPTKSTGRKAKSSQSKFPLFLEWMLLNFSISPVLLFISLITPGSRKTVLELLLYGVLIGGVQAILVSRRFEQPRVWGAIAAAGMLFLSSGGIFIAGIFQWIVLYRKRRGGYFWLALHLLLPISWFFIFNLGLYKLMPLPGLRNFYFFLVYVFLSALMADITFSDCPEYFSPESPGNFKQYLESLRLRLSFLGGFSDSKPNKR